ncbi:formylglycine-generating enzyme family protein [Sorangium sp. So ce1151]|uniref:formylglycine-generating enzyme family protein n=1 Tax=Sorangium sp. So ce1151 TaxID=3133332 RepID=UPI003F62EA24
MSALPPSPLLLAAALALAAVACSCRSQDHAPPAGSAAPGPAAAASPSTADAAPPAAPAAASAGSAGPMVTIPAGELVAGTACGDHPRLPAEELAGAAIGVGEFTIDTYPYPNDPAQPPLTGVTQEKAKQLCEARGRRLCTELEWERACKGPSNGRYEYGDKFDAKACPSGLGAIPAYAAHERCASGFGVRAMHGFVWEWTASAWKRGKEEGKAVLRGGHGDQPYAHMRCSAVRAADPASSEANVGFRCCGGAVNPAEVVIPAPEEAPPALALEVAPDEALLGRLKRALLNAQLKDAAGVTSAFAKVWRWHPTPNEELIVASYESKKEGGAGVVQPLVIRLCDKTVQLIGRLAGPVAEMEEPSVADDAPGTVSFTVKTGEDAGEARFVYQFAQVVTQAPSWIKAGTTLDAPATSAAPSAPAPGAAEAASAPSAAASSPAPRASGP